MFNPCKPALRRTGATLSTHTSVTAIALLSIILAALTTGCPPPIATMDSSVPDAAAPTGRWNCPPDWVASAQGGCGPALLLCVPGGGGANGACNGIDLSRPRSDGADGGARGLIRLPDGAVSGTWPAPMIPGGPPAADWVPDAGISRCAPGWRMLLDGTCDPLVRSDCPAGAAAAPAGTCTATADADCPATDYFDPGPAGVGAAHVMAGADAMLADGSEARPYATIAAALARVAGNGWILVGAGTYDAPVDVTASVHIAGRCAARVILRANSGQPTLHVHGAGVTLDLRGMTLRNGLGLHVSGQAHATVNAVKVDTASGYGVLVEDMNSDLVAESLVVSGTSVIDTSQFGLGVGVRRNATATLRHCVIERNHTVGVLAISSGRITLDQCAVRATQLGPDRTTGVGMSAQFSGSIDATAIIVEDNHQAGAYAEGSGASLRFVDSVVRRTVPLANGSHGEGIRLITGAQLVVERTLIDGNTSAGIAGSATNVRVTDSFVRATRAMTPSVPGVGLAAVENATFTVAGVRVEASHLFGVQVSGGATLDIARSVIRGTRTSPGGIMPCRPSSAMFISTGTVHASSLLVVDNDLTGIGVIHGGSTLRMTDSVIRDGRPCGDFPAVGIALNDNAIVDASRVEVRGHTGFGIIGYQHAALTLTNSSIRNAPGSLGSREGQGIFMGGGGTASIRQTLVSDVARYGISSIGEESVVELVDVGIVAVRPDTGSDFSSGLAALGGGRLTANGVLVADALGLGVVAQDPGSAIELTDVVIRNITSENDYFGFGVSASGGASIAATRLALEETAGAAIAAVPAGSNAQSTVTGADIFVRGVSEQGVRSEPPFGAPVAYGLYAGERCSLQLARVVIDDAGFGAVQSSGVLTVTTGLIARQRLGAAASNGGSAQSLALVDVLLSRNARDDIQRDISLPDVALPPAPIECTMPGPGCGIGP